MCRRASSISSRIAIYADHDHPNQAKPAYTTVQSFVVDMNSMDLWIHFIPSSGAPPRQPTYPLIANPNYR